MEANSTDKCQSCGDSLHKSTNDTLLELISISIWYNKDMQRELTSREIDRAMLAHNANLASISASNLEKELHAVLRSRSWRITSPLRGLERLIKKVTP
jgi:hypothetical protein